MHDARPSGVERHGAPRIANATDTPQWPVRIAHLESLPPVPGWSIAAGRATTAVTTSATSIAGKEE